MSRKRSTIEILMAVLLLAVAGATPLAAQRTFQVGAAVSSLTPTGANDHHTGATITLGWLGGSTSMTEAYLSRYGDADFNTGIRGVTVYGLDSKYFPVEAAGIAPYLSTGIGLFRYTQPGGLLTQPSDQWGFVSTMGLGLGANLTDHLWIGGEGRLRVDNGDRSTEVRLQGSYGLGKLRPMASRPGTIEPFAIGIARLGHGPYTAASPLAGIRFRRDESRHSSIGVDVGLARFDDDRPGAERVTTWVMMPSAEHGWATSWGRPFIELGPQMLGFIGGTDDGMKVGIHVGGGADVYLSPAIESALLTRVTWFQSSDGRHQFGLQLGLAIGPRLMHDRASLPEKAARVE